MPKPSEILTAVEPFLNAGRTLSWAQPTATALTRAYNQHGSSDFIADRRILQPALVRAATVASCFRDDESLGRMHCQNILRLLRELNKYGEIYSADMDTKAWLSQIGYLLPQWQVEANNSNAASSDRGSEPIDENDREGVSLAMDEARVRIMEAIGYVEALEAARVEYKRLWARTKVAKSITSGLIGIDAARYEEETERDYGVEGLISRAKLVAQRAAVPFGFMPARYATGHLCEGAKKQIKSLLASFDGNRENPATIADLQTRVLELGDLAETMAILRAVALMAPDPGTLSCDLPGSIMETRGWLADFDV